MPNTRLFDREKASQRSSDQGQTVVIFNPTTGVGSHSWLTQGASNVSDDLAILLKANKSVVELGRPGIATAISADLSAVSTITVPTGKYWRVLGGFLQYTASADAATRTPVVSLNPALGDPYASFSLSTKTANQVENDHFLVGSVGNVEGTEGVAAQGTLTMATNPTANDTITIDGVVYTFVATDDGSKTNAIVIGANVGETQDNLEAVLVDGTHPTVNAAAFSLNAMVLTARTKGLAGSSIATTETFTDVSDGFDATTLGTTTEGVDEANVIASLDYPTAGALLVGGETIKLTTTNGHANDAAELVIFFLEFDNDPTL